MRVLWCWCLCAEIRTFRGWHQKVNWSVGIKLLQTYTVYVGLKHFLFSYFILQRTYYWFLHILSAHQMLHIFCQKILQNFIFIHRSLFIYNKKWTWDNRYLLNRTWNPSSLLLVFYVTVLKYKFWEPVALVTLCGPFVLQLSSSVFREFLSGATFCGPTLRLFWSD